MSGYNYIGESERVIQCVKEITGECDRTLLGAYLGHRTFGFYTVIMQLWVGLFPGANCEVRNCLIHVSITVQILSTVLSPCHVCHSVQMVHASHRICHDI